MPKTQKAGQTADDEEREYTLMKNDFRSSTKLNALVKHLDRLNKEQPDFKALVFSHFTVRARFKPHEACETGADTRALMPAVIPGPDRDGAGPGGLSLPAL
jgi:hypothetical protein